MVSVEYFGARLLAFSSKEIRKWRWHKTQAARVVSSAEAAGQQQAGRSWCWLLLLFPSLLLVFFFPKEIAKKVVD